MPILKRIFRTIVVFLSILISLLGLFYLWALQPASLGIIQGATDDSSTQFVIVSKESGTHCTVTEENGSSTPISSSQSDEVSFEDSEFKVRKCFFDKLDPDKKYLLSILDAKNQQIAKRRFHLLPLKNENFKVGVISCTSDLIHLPSIWNFFFSQRPDLLLMIGDNVYADIYKSFTDLTHRHLWNRYVNTWRTLKLFQNFDLVPVLGIWDDHDYGVNNGDSLYQGKDFSKFLFDSFFSQKYPNKRMSFGPALSFSYELGRMKLIFVDGRYFRTPDDKPGGSYFIPEQTQWVAKEMKSNKINWIISGNQWFGSKYSEENFEKDQPKGLEDFLKEVNKTNAPYFLVSGDTHFSDIKKINYLGKSIFEVTSSAMHSWPLGPIFPESRSLVTATNQPNFTIAEFNLKSPEEIVFSTFGAFYNNIYKIKISILK